MGLVITSVSVSVSALNRSSLSTSSSHAKTLPAWPREFEGKKLTQIPLSSREKYFMGRFPGKMARFSDGRKQIIMRWVLSPTRKLHPAMDCFRGLGYKISNIKIRRDEKGALWRQFDATNKSANLVVTEHIIDRHGVIFTDTSAWYWNSISHKSQGPWLSVMVAKRR